MASSNNMRPSKRRLFELPSVYEPLSLLRFSATAGYHVEYLDSCLVLNKDAWHNIIYDVYQLPEHRAGNPYFLAACWAGDLTRVRQFLRFDSTLATFQDPRTGRSGLHLAAEGGKLDLIRLLRDRGANVNAGNKYRNTPLHCALDHDVRPDGAATVSLLLSLGADVNVKGANDGTPLHTACRYGHVDAVAVLLAAGAGANVVCLDLRTTPLYSLVFPWVNGDCPKRRDILARLVAAGAQVNFEDAQALGLAIKNRNPYAFIALLDHGSCLPPNSLEDLRTRVVEARLSRKFSPVNAMDLTAFASALAQAAQSQTAHQDTLSLVAKTTLDEMMDHGREHPGFTQAFRTWWPLVARVPDHYSAFTDEQLSGERDVSGLGKLMQAYDLGLVALVCTGHENVGQRVLRKALCESGPDSAKYVRHYSLSLLRALAAVVPVPMLEAGHELPDGQKVPVLFRGIEHGSVALVQALVDRGVDVWTSMDVKVQRLAGTDEEGKDESGPLADGDSADAGASSSSSASVPASGGGGTVLTFPLSGRISPLQLAHHVGGQAVIALLQAAQRA